MDPMDNYSGGYGGGNRSWNNQSNENSYSYPKSGGNYDNSSRFNQGYSNNNSNSYGNYGNRGGGGGGKEYTCYTCKETCASYSELFQHKESAHGTVWQRRGQYNEESAHGNQRLYQGKIDEKLHDSSHGTQWQPRKGTLLDALDKADEDEQPRTQDQGGYAQNNQYGNSYNSRGRGQGQYSGGYNRGGGYQNNRDNDDLEESNITFGPESNNRGNYGFQSNGYQNRGYQGGGGYRNNADDQEDNADGQQQRQYGQVFDKYKYGQGSYQQHRPPWQRVGDDDYETGQKNLNNLELGPVKIRSGQDIQGPVKNNYDAPGRNNYDEQDEYGGNKRQRLSQERQKLSGDLHNNLAQYQYKPKLSGDQQSTNNQYQNEIQIQKRNNQYRSCDPYEEAFRQQTANEQVEQQKQKIQIQNELSKISEAVNKKKQISEIFKGLGNKKQVNVGFGNQKQVNDTFNGEALNKKSSENKMLQNEVLKNDFVAKNFEDGTSTEQLSNVSTAVDSKSTLSKGNLEDKFSTLSKLQSQPQSEKKSGENKNVSEEEKNDEEKFSQQELGECM